MMSETAEDPDPWEAGTFEGAKEAQKREDRNRSFHERLRWCCEMSELIRKQALAEGRVPPALRDDRYG
ncbi:MAG: hypothetical protein AAF546_08315 [Verrucomicrobiota bacterium]